MCIAFPKNAAPTLPPDANNNSPHKVLSVSDHSSTTTTDFPYPQNNVSPSPASAPLPSSKKRRVRFGPTVTEPRVICQLKPSSSMSDNERAEIHWQLQDYEYFRGTARIIATEVFKLAASQPPSAHSYDTVLTRAHQICAQTEAQEEKQDLPLSADADADADDHICLPPNLIAALTHWAKAGHSRRGLEKFCVSHHMQTRPLERQAVVQTVLIAQDMLREMRARDALPVDGKFRIGSWEFPLDLPDDEILRMISERFTKTARKFATAMGHADAAAVGNYEHEQPV